jgi:uncharacterized protein YbjT (DUF2867 family)
MKILILGATGRLGKKVLETALQSNYDVNVLVRDAKKITLRSVNYLFMKAIVRK